MIIIIVYSIESYIYFILSYAFVLHRTNRSAEYNLKKRINYNLFGSNCHVEYSTKNLHPSDEHQDSRTWTIVVKQIPEHVTEEHLRHLFISCHSMKYIPARTVGSAKRILWG
jgi:RNA recognition motif-containing protein